MADEQREPTVIDEVIAQVVPLPTNGAAKDKAAVQEAIDAPERKLRPMVLKDLEVPEGEWAGLRIRYWRNFPYYLQDDIQSGIPNVQRAAIHKVVREWSWPGRTLEVDEEPDDKGNVYVVPLPQPDSPKFRDLLPTPLMMTILGMIIRDVRELPPFLRGNG